jgi:peptide-N4-(N-acetyl-beta-glucosaminyl)asparagine amidase
MESLLHNDPFTFHAVRGKLMFLCVDIVHRPNVERAITDPREIQMFAIASGGLQCLRFIGYSNGNVPYGPLMYTDVLTRQQALFVFNALRSLRHACDYVWAAQARFHFAMERNLRMTVQSPILPHNFVTPIQLQERENLKTIVRIFCEQMQSYDDPRLKEKARRMMPWERMTSDAKEKALEDGHPPHSVAFWDYLVRELARWFKLDFFSWMNEPSCSTCGTKTLSATIRMAPTPEEMYYGASRVEAYSCPKCGMLIRFPRFNSVDKLMDTRVGRCGEWANCFTFFCHILGLKSRYIMDWYGDHVWTEYYSPAQKRWVHVDSCENAVDNPLMYECGWNKPIMYIFALARDHVADVTMRYSCDHRGVISRRAEKFNGSWLYDTFQSLNNHLSTHLTPEKKLELNQLLLSDFVQLLTEPTRPASMTIGRTSGSLAWIASRGEGSRTTGAKHIFKPTRQELAAGKLHIRFSPRLNAYERVSDGMCVRGWHAGTFEVRGVFKKEELDWKMVYLSRSEGTNEGMISWAFSIEDEDGNQYTYDKVEVLFERTVYKSGEVSGTVRSDTKIVPLILDDQDKGQMHEYPELVGGKEVRIEAVLSRGSGDVAWQHAQLFRSSLKDSDPLTFPFEVIITFPRREF